MLALRIFQSISTFRRNISEVFTVPSFVEFKSDMVNHLVKDMLAYMYPSLFFLRNISKVYVVRYPCT